jgi:hypothetical protein
MKKILVFAVIGLLSLGGCVSVTVPSPFEQETTSADNSDTGDNLASNEETEYWALLVGVTEIANSPQMDIPYNNLVIENLRDMLLVSEFWHNDHIKTLIGREATYHNIINGFKWLDEKADKYDVCLFYITGHGGYFPIDLPPFDETDGDGDEVLYTWTSGIGLGNIFNRFPQLPQGIPLFGSLPYIHDISDDQLKSLLNKLDAEGVCVIIDTCYSGGFNDSADLPQEYLGLLNTHTEKTHHEWSQSFAAELSNPGKVILMSCRGSELSQGACFTYFAIEGFQGTADENHDGLCSAEEVFHYAAPRTECWLKEYKHWEQHPQLYDNYPGELPLTNVEQPPTEPSPLSGQLIGEVGIEHTYAISSADIGGDKVRYFIDWGDGTTDLTPWYDSNQTVNISHVWTEEGTYNVWLETEDEHGARQYHFGFPPLMTVIMSDMSIVDQYQSRIYQPEGFYENIITNTVWQAQSFVPNCTILSKVDIWALSVSDTATPLTVSLRHDLAGSDLVSVSKMVPALNQSKKIPEGWTTFDFPGIHVIPGETYYVVSKH